MQSQASSGLSNPEHRSRNPIFYENLRAAFPETKVKSFLQHRFDVDTLIKAAAKESLQGNAGPFTHQSNGWTLQIRRVNLSKTECLPCHQGQKLGDPVALMAYLATKAPPSR